MGQNLEPSSYYHRITAAIILDRKTGYYPYGTLFLIPCILGFWVLDGYFLWQERLFRRVYDEVRVQFDTDFQMDPLKHRDKPKCSWVSAIFSVTLVIFYLIEIAFAAFLFFIVKA